MLHIDIRKCLQQIILKNSLLSIFLLKCEYKTNCWLLNSFSLDFFIEFILKFELFKALQTKKKTSHQYMTLDLTFQLNGSEFYSYCLNESRTSKLDIKYWYFCFVTTSSVLYNVKWLIVRSNWFCLSSYAIDFAIFHI